MFSIIITAGGIGKRMESSIPKQFLELKGLPILMHTIQRFSNVEPACQILVTLPSDWISFWEELLVKHVFTIKHEVIQGGIERYDSIKNALSKCHFEFIGIHDGVRPFVSNQTISNCLNLVQEKGNAIPTLDLKESLRQINVNSVSKAVKRSEFVHVQTPQFFNKEIISNAYKIPFHTAITDDASLVEEAGFDIHLCAGNEENIKITTPLDLKIGELFVDFYN
ncbi:MAG: 2-C-methyl-D-erythritol 4-phosphate cytidylyltransferase [Flavobacteriia bacterium]|nr:2-C-methyl-D-erythritol 4-phosphate cytidylyltransferase [Flavobacteriia bacterium]